MPTSVEDRGLRSGDRGRVTASILCPVDFSDESVAALRRAAVIAERSGARLAALHVADALLVRAATGAYHRDVVVHESARAMQDLVDQIRQQTAAERLEAGAYVVVGDPATEICAFCRGHDIDLIVMASHQLTRYRRLFFGSVADGVVRGAPAPVLVFPPQESRASSLCVTLRLDGTALSHT